MCCIISNDINSFVQNGKWFQCMNDNHKIAFPLKFEALKPMFILKTEKRYFKNCAYY